MTDYKKIYSLLGLAEKARKVKSGEFQTEQSVKAGGAALVIIAEDSSDNTKKKFKDMCAFYKVPCTVFGDKDGIGNSIGKEMRASVSVEDKGLADAIQKQLKALGITISNSKDINQEDGKE